MTGSIPPVEPESGEPLKDAEKKDTQHPKSLPESINVTKIITSTDKVPQQLQEKGLTVISSDNPKLVEKVKLIAKVNLNDFFVILPTLFFPDQKLLEEVVAEAATANGCIFRRGSALITEMTIASLFANKGLLNQMGAWVVPPDLVALTHPLTEFVASYSSLRMVVFSPT